MIDLSFMKMMEYKKIKDVPNDFLEDLFVAETIVDIAFMMDDRSDFKAFRAENVNLVEDRLDYSLIRFNFGGNKCEYEGMEGLVIINKIFDILNLFLPENVTVHHINRFDDDDSVNHQLNETFIEWGDIRKIDKKGFEKFVKEYVAKLAYLEGQYYKTRSEFAEYIEKKNKMVDVLRGENGYR